MSIDYNSNSYKLDNSVVCDYIDSRNFYDVSNCKSYIDIINTQLLEIKQSNPRKKGRINYDIICQLANANNGIVTNKMLEPFKISRQYICDLVEKNKLERIDRGIFCLCNSIEDSYYIFQQKHMKTIFSHMNALYFCGLTEEFPDLFTVTVSSSYHDNDLKEKCDVFYVRNEHMIIGLTTLKTPMGNFVRSYDMERSICDIIRSLNRMDFEQVKKTVKKYMKREDKDLIKLSKYAKELNIQKKVMNFVGMFDE